MITRHARVERPRTQIPPEDFQVMLAMQACLPRRDVGTLTSAGLSEREAHTLPAFVDEMKAIPANDARDLEALATLAMGGPLTERPELVGASVRTLPTQGVDGTFYTYLQLIPDVASEFDATAI